MIRVETMFCKWLAAVCAICLMPFVPNANAQSSGGGGGQTSAPSTPSPGSGVTNGTAPIETTLFAYRALASDAAAVSHELAPLAAGSEVVIGTPADVAAFTQWRSVIGQIRVLANKANVMHTQLTGLAGYTAALPLPALSITKTHSGNFVAGKRGTYTVTVSNSPAASPTSGTVTVTEALPVSGLSLVSMAGPDWICPRGAKSCSTDKTLFPGASYPPITVTVSVADDASSSLVNTVTVSGGGSANATATDTTAITPAAKKPAAGLYNFMAAPQAATSAGGGTGTPPTPAAGGLAAATSAIPVFVQLAQFLATAFAVNQTLTPSQGSMTDAPLINMVARHLRARGVEVLIPSVYTPNLLLGNSLDQTYLWRELQSLEAARLALTSDVATYNQFLMQANFIVQNPAKYAVKGLNEALAYSGQAQSLLTSAQALAASIDTFEASFFGAQPPQSGSVPASPSSAGPSSSPNSSGSSSSPTPAAGGATPPSNNASGATNAGSSNSGNSPSSAPSGNMLQQILAADLLAQRLWPGARDYTDIHAEKINFLTVHALESGGTQLTKTNIFYGTHIFFSGGSVMTFSLFASTGDVRCSGFAYNYHGNVREKNYDKDLHSELLRNAIVETDARCGPLSAVLGSLSKIKKGMTEADVEEIMGAPDAAFHDGNTLVLSYQSIGGAIEIKHGKVTRILRYS